MPEMNEECVRIMPVRLQDLAQIQNYKFQINFKSEISNLKFQVWSFEFEI